jgi:glycosyltransferase involved in cell wall biosynthesis
LSQTDEDFEVIVVDAGSTDGSLERLRRYSSESRITLIVKRCSRGMGRQIAFENASGEYIIANMDLDETYRPRLKELLAFYHERCDGLFLLSLLEASEELREFQNVTVLPRAGASQIGGWHDLQYGEDWELLARAAKAGKYVWTVFPLLDKPNHHLERSTTLNKVRFRFMRHREMLRSGREVFRQGERGTINQKLFRLLASGLIPFYKTYRDPFNRTFDSYDETYRLR